MTSHLAVTFSQPFTMRIGGCQHHDRVQVSIQPPQIAAPRTLGERLAPPGQHNRAQQQRLHARGENRVARIDRVFAVAQLVRQADLPEIGMSLLRAIRGRDLDRIHVPVAKERAKLDPTGVGDGFRAGLLAANPEDTFSAPYFFTTDVVENDPF